MLIPTITLRPGDAGDNVRELQRRLHAVDQLSEAQINGSYDGSTTEAVRSFQSLCALEADGIAGPKTIRKLNAVVAGTATMSDGDSGTRQEEEEVERQADVAKQAMAEELREDELAPEVLGMEDQHKEKKEEKTVAPAPPPPPPPRLDAEELAAAKAEGPKTTEKLFLDDPRLETDVTQSKPKDVPEKEAAAPAPPARQDTQAATTAIAEQSAAGEKSIPVPPQAGEPIRFDDPKLQAIEDKLPEPVKVEVKQVGVGMKQAGVKETAVPAEMQIGGPSQTPEMQKNQQQSAEIG